MSPLSSHLFLASLSCHAIANHIGYSHVASLDFFETINLRYVRKSPLPALAAREWILIPRGPSGLSALAAEYCAMKSRPMLVYRFAVLLAFRDQIETLLTGPLHRYCYNPRRPRKTDAIDELIATICGHQAPWACIGDIYANGWGNSREPVLLFSFADTNAEVARSWFDPGEALAVRL